ncbi:hypothetical protein JAAARDRAFT_36494 [Jaapia argillacea MUCL 33604]|uniref:Peptidase metallopeptidase domain-containing protein n=1 Tax=Jaapia argillacea MUCL 33604 TaxID=933084 RepID=A0A067PNE8_9AGAM|nr:hypothetical protein JAAARDRAFT_36494 [Jaapia argillacea MUCL 33604]
MPHTYSDPHSFVDTHEEEGFDVARDSSGDESLALDICTEVPSRTEFPTRETSDVDDASTDSDAAPENTVGFRCILVMAAAGSGDRNPRGLMWDVGREIRIRFLGGSYAIRRDVIRYARMWETHANIKFRFSPTLPSHIRISFIQENGSHSFVGTDALTVPEPHPTMNLAVTSLTSPTEFRGTVLHEFGHALGCHHEHGSPDARIEWRTERVYRWYGKRGWDKDKVDEQVLRPRAHSEVTQFSLFDRRSIMTYYIPPHFTRNGLSVPRISRLSNTDKQFIGRMYPYPPDRQVRVAWCL